MIPVVVGALRKITTRFETFAEGIGTGIRIELFQKIRNSKNFEIGAWMLSTQEKEIMGF